MWTGVLGVYNLAPLPVHSFYCVFVAVDAISQFPVVTTSCCQASSASMDSPSGTISPNELLFPQVALVVAFYHRNRKVVNMQGLLPNPEVIDWLGWPASFKNSLASG